MPNYLVIVESPSKAKTINKYLGKNYTVMASVGHLRDLPKSKLGVDVEHDFKPDYITIRGKGELITKLKKAAKNADKIYLATDPDREGEAISWHIANLLGIDDSTPCRVTFNAVTKSAVTASFKEARAIDHNLVDAQQARRVLDRIVGYKISPLLWEKVKKGLSAGRVQSATTKLVVDREREIMAFEPKEYWTIVAKLTDEKGKHPFEARYYGENGKKKEIGSKAECDAVLEKIKNADFVVDSVTYGKKSRHAAPPFTTSTLIQDAGRKLGFASKRTMSTAQGLYEGVDIPGRGTLGLITYMRTDSLRIAPEAQAAARELIGGKFGKEYVPQKPNFYKTGKNAQDAHEAIRPSVVEIEPESIKGKVTSDQYRLYKLIWERFIASQMANAEYNTMNADITANGVNFKATSTAVSFMGYTAVYVESSDDEEEEKNAKRLIQLENGMKLRQGEITPAQHFTEPPARYNEASLTKAMEDSGIGRPSTYASTISTIVGRDYVIREKKLLKPTELGFIVTDLMAANFKDIVDLDFTANMEKQLDSVEEGQADWVEVVSDFYGPFEESLEKAKTSIEKIKIKDEESDEICEKCGRRMVIKMGRYGKFLACPGFPECRNAKPILKDTGVACPKCGGRIVEKKSQKGKKYFACENSPATCDFYLWDEPIKTPCPKCGSIMTRKYVKKHSVTTCTNKDCESNAKVEKPAAKEKKKQEP
ncbi:MAG: type I DNA topoisomerase [Oscillospiraceae bacterium]|nr:type I DNA topoisomerase [Oscillospiraceae bacterium]